jgi:hypothetical protein
VLTDREHRELLSLATKAQARLAASGRDLAIAVQHLQRVSDLKDHRHAGDPVQPSLGLAIKIADEGLAKIGLQEET